MWTVAPTEVASRAHYAVVTRERNALQKFQHFILRVTASETAVKKFEPLKSFTTTATTTWFVKLLQLLQNLFRLWLQVKFI